MFACCQVGFVFQYTTAQEIRSATAKLYEVASVAHLRPRSHEAIVSKQQSTSRIERGISTIHINGGKLWRYSACVNGLGPKAEAHLYRTWYQAGMVQSQSCNGRLIFGVFRLREANTDREWFCHDLRDRCMHRAQVPQRTWVD